MGTASLRRNLQAAVALTTGLGVAAAVSLSVAGQAAASSQLLYLAAPSSSSTSTGVLTATAPAPARAITTRTGRKTGWYALRAGALLASAGPFSSAPAPDGAGYAWPSTEVAGSTISTGTWSTTVTMRAVGTVTLVPRVRVYKVAAIGGYTLLGTLTGSSVRLGSTARTITLPSATLPATSFATGDHLYLDLLAKVTNGSSSSAAIVVTDSSGAGASLAMPALTATPVAPDPTTSAPAPTTSAPAPTTSAPAPTTSAPAPTTSAPAPTTSAPVPTTSAPAPTTTAAAAVWQPHPGTSWQWQITGKVDTSLAVQMYDIDLFDAQSAASSYTVPGFGTVNVPAGENAGVIPALHAQGKVVICYLDTGAWENYRPDQALFPASVIGGTTGWSGEKWLDIRSSAWASFEPLIAARLDLAARSGCDGVEPDQNNPYGNKPGFPITVADQTAWYLEVARMAHERHLSVGMKNGIESVGASTITAFDWALNEECNMYDECSVMDGFISAGKAVFQVEYSDEGMTTAMFCAADDAANFDGLLKQLELGVPRTPCR